MIVFSMVLAAQARAGLRGEAIVLFAPLVLFAVRGAFRVGRGLGFAVRQATRVPWFLQKNDDVHNAVMEGGDYHIMGGNVGKLHDQMMSLSEIYWISGAAQQFWPCGKQ